MRDQQENRTPSDTEKLRLNPLVVLPSVHMAYDPFYTSNPSDSGLLDGIDPAQLASDVARHQAGRSKRVGNVPHRDEYTAPTPAPVDSEAVEESLQEVPLPEGFMARLRGLVTDL